MTIQILGTEIPDDDMTQIFLQKPTVMKENIELCKFGLEANRYVVAKQFQGKFQVDISGNMLKDIMDCIRLRKGSP